MVFMSSNLFSPQNRRLDFVRGRFQKENPQTWLFCGDSITHGDVHTHGVRDYTQHFAERVCGEMRRRQDCVINTAVSGFTSRMLREEFEVRAARFMPTVAFLMLGMNDCSRASDVGLEEFSENLAWLCRAFRGCKC